MLSTIIETVVALALGSVQGSHYAQQTSTGRVMLDVWPQWRDTVLVVQVRATTHTVDLGAVNLREQVRLVLAGTEIAPLSAGRLCGHDAMAEVVFRLDERPSGLTITIRGVPDVPERTMTWPPAPRPGTGSTDSGPASR